MFSNKQRPTKPEVVKNVIGKSIRIQGDVHGDEDLLVDGRVDGNVELRDHHLTIAGVVEGDVYGRLVTVLGHVVGNVYAAELVELRETASVTGDIQASRFSIEENASLNGAIKTHTSASDHPNLSLVKGDAPGATKSVEPTKSENTPKPPTQPDTRPRKVQEKVHVKR